MKHLESKHYLAAVADLSRAIELIEDEKHQAHLAVVLAARAAAYNNHGNHAKAVGDISRAIDLASNPYAISGFRPLELDTVGKGVVVSKDTIVTWRLLRANALMGVTGRPPPLIQIAIAQGNSLIHERLGCRC